MENELKKKGVSDYEFIDYNNNLYQENEELKNKLANEVNIKLKLDAFIKKGEG